jgi:hypothetical protein
MIDCTPYPTDPTPENFMDYASDPIKWESYSISFTPNGVWWLNYYSNIHCDYRRMEISKKASELIQGIWNLYYAYRDRQKETQESIYHRAKRRVQEFKSMPIVS